MALDDLAVDVPELTRLATVGAVGRGRVHDLGGPCPDQDFVGECREWFNRGEIQRLSTHQRILLDVVRDRGEIGAGALHDEYEERAQNPKSKPTRRRYLGSLERYKLIEQIGRTRGTWYQYCEP